MLYFFILGLVCPILVWLAARKWPNSVLRYVSTPVIFGGTGYIPPATVLIYGSWGFVGTMFNKGTYASCHHNVDKLTRFQSSKVVTQAGGLNIITSLPQPWTLERSFVFYSSSSLFNCQTRLRLLNGGVVSVAGSRIILIGVRHRRLFLRMELSALRAGNKQEHS